MILLNTLKIKNFLLMMNGISEKPFLEVAHVIQILYYTQILRGFKYNILKYE